MEKPVKEAWAKLMLDNEYRGFETTKKCMEKVRESEFVRKFREEVEGTDSPRKINEGIKKYFIGAPEEFDGTGISKDPYKDFVQSMPYFFLKTKQPNCLGRAIIVASIFPETKIAEVLKTNQLDNLFDELKMASKLIEDDKVYMSRRWDGTPVYITGKTAKTSILEAILYNEEPHPTIIDSYENILDPVEFEFGAPIYIEYPLIEGITAMTFNNLCGFIGLFSPYFARGEERRKEAEYHLKGMLKVTPESVTIRRNLMLFKDLSEQYELLREIEDIYTSKGVDMPCNLYIVKAYLQTLSGNYNKARETLEYIREKYILPYSIEIIKRNIPLLEYVRTYTGWKDG